MEFIKYYDFVSGKEKENRSIPRVGTLHVSGDFDGSDNNFYPNHEVFGRCKGGSYPLYATYCWEQDYDNPRVIKHILNDSIFADIPGTSYDGGSSFNHPFRIYGYEVGEYLSEGKEMRGVRFRIELDEPFHFDPNDEFKGIQGYDRAWLER